MKKLGQVKSRECLLPFGVESFAFAFAFEGY